MRRVYLAHALSAPTSEGVEHNRQQAATWAAWVSLTFRVAVSADWITLTGQLAETPENRAWGLECDKAHIERCDELWMVGVRVSEGMSIGAQHARAHGLGVFDLTGIEYLANALFADAVNDGFLRTTEKRFRAALAEQGWAPPRA